MLNGLTVVVCCGPTLKEIFLENAYGSPLPPLPASMIRYWPEINSSFVIGLIPLSDRTKEVLRFLYHVDNWLTSGTVSSISLHSKTPPLLRLFGRTNKVFAYVFSPVVEHPIHSEAELNLVINMGSIPSNWVKNVKLSVEAELMQ